tara:strand:+ start:163 stop:495 length:333 start_codon:yes stop_codon:yes gene_type:complete
MTFTARQKMFANKIFDGSNKSDAYREAYAPVLMSRKTIWEAASRLSKNPKVIARLDQLSAEKEQNNRMFALSYEDRIINKLWDIVDTSKNKRVRIKALELLGRSCGLFTN